MHRVLDSEAQLFALVEIVSTMSTLLLAINRVCWTGIDASSLYIVQYQNTAKGSMLTEEGVSGAADGLHYNTSTY